MILVIGATGILGSTVCQLLKSAGYDVRALVRETSDPEKVNELRRAGVETAVGDLKDPASLEAACNGVSTVISTASSTASRGEGDSIISVDRDGQLGLIAAAEKAGVEHFLYVSFHKMAAEFPLQDAKRRVEQELRSSGLAYTILQPTFFMEVWLGPHLGFDPLSGKVRLYGSGENRLPWISLVDVARFLVAAVDNPEARNKTFELGGPDHLSPREVVELFERVSGKSLDVELVPEKGIRAQMEAATNALEESFAGLMLSYHQGYHVDMTEALELMPVEQTTVEDYARRILTSSSGPA